MWRSDGQKAANTWWASWLPPAISICLQDKGLGRAVESPKGAFKGKNSIWNSSFARHMERSHWSQPSLCTFHTVVTEKSPLTCFLASSEGTTVFLHTLLFSRQTSFSAVIPTLIAFKVHYLLLMFKYHFLCSFICPHLIFQTPPKSSTQHLTSKQQPQLKPDVFQSWHRQKCS